MPRFAHGALEPGVAVPGKEAVISDRGRRTNRHSWVLAVVVAISCTGCLGASPTASSGPTAGASPIATAAPGLAAASPTAPAAATPFASTPAPTSAACPVRVLASLTEPERIGQLFMLGLADDGVGAPERSAIASWHFGSAWFTAQSSAGTSAIGAVSRRLQALATRQATAGVGFLLAANQEGGLIQALSGRGFETIPSALVQGAMSPAALQVAAARWGLQLRAAGVDMDFAPVADVVPSGTEAQNAPVGQLQREYGHDPAAVRSHVFAFIRGMAQAGVATTMKHFPGLGRVEGNTDFTGAVIDTVTTLADPYLEPFSGAIAAGVPFVMVSLATYERIDPARLAVFSPIVIGQLLRRDLHFAGVVISDDLGAAAAVAAIPPATRALDFLEAGGDMIISKTIVPAGQMARAIAARAATDRAFRARVDDAVLRILRAKEAEGLLPCGT